MVVAQIESSEAIKKEKPLQEELKAPKMEVLNGVAPEVEEKDGVFLYTYSGGTLDKEAKDANAVKITPPFWKEKDGAEIVMLYRPSPRHKWQDTLTVLVDTNKRIISWGEADGATIVDGQKDNDSGNLARKLARQVEVINWYSGHWTNEAYRGIKKVHEDFRASGKVGGASLQLGRVGHFKFENRGGNWEYSVETACVGSNRNIKEIEGVEVFRPGDRGGIEVFYDEDSPHDYREFPKGRLQDIGEGTNRSAVGLNEEPPPIHSGQDFFPAEKRLWLALYSDGIDPIPKGKFVSPGIKFKERLKRGITNESLRQAWKDFKMEGIITKGDDVSLLLISLPKNKKH